jgi:NhaC family Na+:H+ antiporter
MLYAILAGLAMFFLQGLRRGIPARRLFLSMIPGFRKSLIVVVVICLIGAMSAAWRGSGLMALLVVRGLSLIYPPLFLLFAFLLCSAFAFALGSSIGAASVMGVLLITIGNAARVNPLFTSGAILSGIYFGDRASFLSSSALLVSTLAQVDHTLHLRNMIKSSIVPFAASALAYALLSAAAPFDASHARDILALKDFFALGNPLLWLPLAIVFLPAFTKIKLAASITLSAIVAVALSILIQGAAPAAALRDLVFGYHRDIDDPQLRLLYGGGLVSMLKPMAIVFFSGALPPLLGELGTLAPIQRRLARLAGRKFPFAAALASGALTSLIGCSQSLAVFLQAPLLDKVYPAGKNEEKAKALGSTSILLSALVPWNIAMAAPLAIIGGSPASGAFAFYLYLLPLITLAAEGVGAKKSAA